MKQLSDYTIETTLKDITKAYIQLQSLGSLSFNSISSTLEQHTLFDHVTEAGTLFKYLVQLICHPLFGDIRYDVCDYLAQQLHNVQKESYYPIDANFANYIFQDFSVAMSYLNMSYEFCDFASKSDFGDFGVIFSPSYDNGVTLGAIELARELIEEGSEDFEIQAILLNDYFLDLDTNPTPKRESYEALYECSEHHIADLSYLNLHSEDLDKIIQDNINNQVALAQLICSLNNIVCSLDSCILELSGFVIVDSSSPYHRGEFRYSLVTSIAYTHYSSCDEYELDESFELVINILDSKQFLRKAKIL